MSNTKGKPSNIRDRTWERNENLFGKSSFTYNIIFCKYIQFVLPCVKIQFKDSSREMKQQVMQQEA